MAQNSQNPAIFGQTHYHPATFGLGGNSLSGLQAALFGYALQVGGHGIRDFLREPAKELAAEDFRLGQASAGGPRELRFLSCKAGRDLIRICL